MVIALFLGAAGCIITSRANSIGQVIVGQAITGFSGINQALPQAITSEVLPRKYRSWAQTLINTPGAMGALLGIYLTGAMTRHSPEGFRNFWYLTAALFFSAGCTITYFYRPPVRELQRLSLGQKLHAIDIPGSLMLATSLLGITLALNWANNPYSWRNAHVLVPFITGICAGLALILYAIHYRKDGIFHHDLFRSRNFVISEICLVGEGVVFIAANNYLAFQLSTMYGAGPWEIAMIFTVAWYVWIFTAPLFGWFIARTQRAKLVVILSLASFTLYFALMASTNLHTKTNILGYNVFLGLGLSGGILALITLAQLSIPPELIAPATGLIVATRTFGASIGLVVFNAILNSVLSSNLVPQISEAATSAGLPVSSLQALLSALVGRNASGLTSVPQINQDIIEASTLAMRKVYNIAFRDGYAGAAAFSAVAMIAAFFAEDPKQEYTATVDAPLLTQLEPKDKP